MDKLTNEQIEHFIINDDDMVNVSITADEAAMLAILLEVAVFEPGFKHQARSMIAKLTKAIQDQKGI